MNDPVAQLALCKWLRDRIKDWEAEAKAELSMVAGERKAAIVNGTRIGYLTLANGKRSTEVDEHALVEWVKEHAPGEIVEAVRPSYRSKLVAGAIQKGALIDSDGVVSDAITVSRGEPYPTTQLGDEADIVISALLGKGQLGLYGLKEIES